MTFELKDVTAGYGPQLVLDGVDLALASGEILAIIGPNGAGKSTLLKTAARLLAPRSGTVLLDGRAAAEFPARELARVLACFGQFHAAPGGFTVTELVRLGRYPYRGLTSRKADAAAVEQALIAAGAESLRDRRLDALSGGERQRAFLALALAQEPQILLLDEPTAYLDWENQFRVLEQVRELNRKRGTTVLLALHDLNLAARFAHRLAVLKAGRLVRTGPPDAVLTPQLLADVFGVAAEVVRSASGVLCCLISGRLRQ